LYIRRNIELANALNTTADELLQDSLENTAVITQCSFSNLLADCSSYEQKVLLDIITAAKETLRNNEMRISSHRNKW